MRTFIAAALFLICERSFWQTTTMPLGRWVTIAEEMSLRYLGPNGPRYLEPTLTEPRWLFFIEPIETKSWQGVDWPAQYKHSDWGEAKGGAAES